MSSLDQYSTGSVSERRVAQMIGLIGVATAALATVQINSAQLKSLGKTAITLVPAVPGRTIWPFMGRLFSHYGSTPYTSTGSGLLYPGNPAAYGNSDNSWGWFGLDVLTQTVNSDEGYYLDTSPNPSDLFVGKSLVLYGDGVSPSGGDGTATVVLIYRVI